MKRKCPKWLFSVCQFVLPGQNGILCLIFWISAEEEKSRGLEWVAWKSHRAFVNIILHHLLPVKALLNLSCVVHMWVQDQRADRHRVGNMSTAEYFHIKQCQVLKLKKKVSQTDYVVRTPLYLGSTQCAVKQQLWSETHISESTQKKWTHTHKYVDGEVEQMWITLQTVLNGVRGRRGASDEASSDAPPVSLCVRLHNSKGKWSLMSS